MPANVPAAAPGTHRDFSAATTKPLEGDLVLPRGLHVAVDEPRRIRREHLAHRRLPRHRRLSTNSAAQPSCGPNRPMAVRHLATQDTSVLIAPPGIGQDRDRLRRNRFTSHVRPHPGRPQGAGRSVARPAAQTSRLQMWSDRWRTVEDHRHHRCRTAAHTRPPRTMSMRSPPATDSSSSTNATMSPPRVLRPS